MHLQNESLFALLTKLPGSQLVPVNFAYALLTMNLSAVLCNNETLSAPVTKLHSSPLVTINL
jgi:hypothetical protein